MIKTSNRSRALKALGLGVGALGVGALGLGTLARGLQVRPGRFLPADAWGINANLDRVYAGLPITERLFRQPIQLDSADPFTSINNIRQRAVDANEFSNQVLENPHLRPAGLNEEEIRNGVLMGEGYLNSDKTGYERRMRGPLASF